MFPGNSKYRSARKHTSKVSRAVLKLEKAINNFGVSGRQVSMDEGAPTGVYRMHASVTRACHGISIDVVLCTDLTGVCATTRELSAWKKQTSVMCSGGYSGSTADFSIDVSFISLTKVLLPGKKSSDQR